MTPAGGYSYAGVVYATKTSRPGLGICVLAVIVSGSLSSVLLGIAVVPIMAGTAVSAGLSGGMNFGLSNVIALAIVLAVVRPLVQAWIVRWIITVSGAVVSFGRVVSALLLGNLVGLAAAVVGAMFFAQMGVGGFWLLSLAGFVVSVIVLYQGGESMNDSRTGAPYTYNVPPTAPPGWPGTDL